MNPRSILLILLAVGFAGGTVFVANKWLSSMRAAYTQKQPEPVKKEAKVQVLVAKEDLPAGTLIQEKHFAWQPWPDASLPKSYVVKKVGEAGQAQIAAYFGAVVRKGIPLGSPVLQGAVVKPGERGFLAAVLHPGMRAVSVPVNATTGAAGFIFPGDRIDLLLTHTISIDEEARRVSETVLTNVRVLAVDQSSNDQKGKAKVAKSVTLEVTPKQVEVVNVVRTLGNLSLSLRALAQTEGERARMGEKPIKASAAVEGGNGKAGAMKQPGMGADTGPGVAGENGKKPFDGNNAEVRNTAGNGGGDGNSIIPGRGKSYTWDSQVSRILKGGEAGTQPEVTVLRGSKAEQVTVTLPNGQKAVINMPPGGGNGGGTGASGGAQPGANGQAGGGGQEQ